MGPPYMEVTGVGLYYVTSILIMKSKAVQE